MDRNADWIGSLWHDLAALPVVLRFSLFGSALGAVLGGVLGLVLGLRAHPPTAWFAVIEVGLPGAFVGMLAGLFVGSITKLVSGGRSQPRSH